MTAPYVFAGAADSGRIIRLGAPALTQITSAGTESVLFDAEPWDLFPAGPGTVAIFRLVVVRFWCDAGYNLRLTPKVDGTYLTPQDFSSSATGEIVLKAWLTQRGSSGTCRVQQLTRLGQFELLDIQLGYHTLRAFP